MALKILGHEDNMASLLSLTVTNIDDACMVNIPQSVKSRNEVLLIECWFDNVDLFCLS